MHLAELTKYAVQGQRHSQRMQRTGIGNGGWPLWTEAETEICRSLYPDYKAMRKALPHRTQAALATRCQTLDIAKRRRIWTARSDALFRRLDRTASASELCAAFPDHSLKKLCCRGSALGLSRPKVRYKPTGLLYSTNFDRNVRDET